MADDAGWQRNETRVGGGVPDQRACAKADSGSGQLDCGWEEDQAICHTPASASIWLRILSESKCSRAMLRAAAECAR